MTNEAGPPALTDFLEAIDRCFAHDSVEAVLAALDEDDSAWGPLAATTIRLKSPTSLKISFRELRDGRSLSFDDCLRMEFRMVSRVMAGSDFLEGVRATIIDKDNEPAWSPETLPEVTDFGCGFLFRPAWRERAGIVRGTPPCALRSAFAKAPADMSTYRPRRSFSVDGQAQYKGSLSAIGVCAIGNLLILSHSKDARRRCNDK